MHLLSEWKGQMGNYFTSKSWLVAFLHAKYYTKSENIPSASKYVTTISKSVFFYG